MREIADFQQWREVCRELILRECAPEQVMLTEQGKMGLLFDTSIVTERTVDRTAPFKVPQQFMELAEAVACHSDPRRWNVLYSILWRLTHGQPQLLRVTVDDDIRQLQLWEKQVRRDCHKMKAFVRFRQASVDASGQEYFVAWHRPDHRIVKRVAPFFSRRFRGMNWSIFTPHESAHWDGNNLTYGFGSGREAAPEFDELEQLWKSYYGAIFNPARIKTQMMKKEMPVRHWATLPETDLIDELLKAAPARVDEMIRRTEGLARSAANFFPEDRSRLSNLQEAANRCEGCDLCHAATQTVFGDGPANARLMLVGEQPGDEEDLAGKPFVGPAGRLLDEVMGEFGFDRNAIYVTNAVKHFRFEEHGKMRLHKKPSVRQVVACKPWLDAEIEVVRPTVIVGLGATALESILGRQWKLTQIRGTIIDDPRGFKFVGTWHPAAILRAPGDLRIRRLTELRRDLQVAIAAMDS